MAKRVLVAPLDWGLGHATRCIPIIQALLRQGATVILASDGRAYHLLQKEFPNLIIEKLPVYNIRYQSRNMFWNIGLQLPKIIWAAWKEHSQLKKLIQKYNLDIVIADNRFGCFSRHAKCIFVTHQVNILIPNFILKTLVNWMNHLLIRQFDECWIPDEEDEENLAGVLAHPSFLKNTTYTGILSRMQPLQSPKIYDAIIVLSGPEPQRTYLEQIILKQAKDLPYKILLVQGKSEGDKKRLSDSVNLQIHPFLNAKDLNAVMAASEVVICRSGYSSIMDLAVLGKKAILIPTPGQTEQEYLARRFFEKQVFCSQQQKDLNLAEALEKVKNFSGLQSAQYLHSKQLEVVIHDLLHS